MTSVFEMGSFGLALVIDQGYIYGVKKRSFQPMSNVFESHLSTFRLIVTRHAPIRSVQLEVTELSQRMGFVATVSVILNLYIGLFSLCMLEL